MGVVLMILGFASHLGQESGQLAERMGLTKLTVGLLVLGGYGFLLMLFYYGGVHSLPRYPSAPQEVAHGASQARLALVFISALLVGVVLSLWDTGRFVGEIAATVIVGLSGRVRTDQGSNVFIFAACEPAAYHPQPVAVHTRFDQVCVSEQPGHTAIFWPKSRPIPNCNKAFPFRLLCLASAGIRRVLADSMILGGWMGSERTPTTLRKEGGSGRTASTSFLSTAIRNCGYVSQSKLSSPFFQ